MSRTLVHINKNENNIFDKIEYTHIFRCSDGQPKTMGQILGYVYLSKNFGL